MLSVYSCKLCASTHQGSNEIQKDKGLRHRYNVPQACGDAAADVSNYKELFPSIFTAQALTNCDMYLLHAAEFQQLVEEYPGVKAKLQAWALRSAAELGYLLSQRILSPVQLQITSCLLHLISCV